MTIAQLTALSPDLRKKEMHKPEFIKWLEYLVERSDFATLDEIGRLLCHASPRADRLRHPIIGDAHKADSDKANQESFETSVFGAPLGDGIDPNQKPSLRGDMPGE